MSLASVIASYSPAGLWWGEETSGTTLVDSGGGGHNGTIDAGVALNATGIIPNRLPAGSWETNASEGGVVTTNTWVDGTEISGGVWIYFDVMPGVNGAVVFARANVNASNSRANKAWAIQVSSAGAILGRIYSNTSVTVVPTSANGVITTSGLYFIGFRQTASNFYFRVNKVQVATAAIAGGPVAYANNTQPISIGRSSVTGTYVMFGRVKGAVYFNTDIGDAGLDAIYDAGVAAAGYSGDITATLPALATAITGTATVPVYTGTATATLPSVTTAIEGDYSAPPVGDLTTVLPSLTTTITGGYLASVASGSVDAVLPIVAVTLSGTYTPAPITGDLTADLPSLTFAATGLFIPAISGDMDADLPMVAASFSGTFSTAGPQGSMSVVLPMLDVSFGTSINWSPTRRDITSGRIRRGIGYATWTPAVVPLPDGLVAATGQSVVTALAFSEPTYSGLQPIVSVETASEPRHRDRIIIDAVDRTYELGAEAQVSSFQLMEPFGYGTASIEFPQIRGCFGIPVWAALGAKVLIQRVDASDNVVATDYRGVVTAINSDGASISLDVGGEFTGPASLRWRPMPVVRRTFDIGYLMWQAAQLVKVRSTPRRGAVTGIKMARTGGMTLLEHAQQIAGRGTTRSGRQWTLMPNEDGVYVNARKDLTTKHVTIYLDDANAVGSLRRDVAEEPNRIYATSVNDEGMVIDGTRIPGADLGDTPEFPGFLTEGDTGDGVVALISALRVHGMLNSESALGGYDEDVSEAVRTIQEDAGLAVTGNVNSATWDALFDTNVVGFSTKLARREPAAQRSYTKRWLYSGSGAIIGRNPDFDPSRLISDKSFDFGTGFGQKQTREFSKTEIVDGSEPNWVGQIVLNTGAVIVGEHTPGDPITEIMADRDIRPGMNAWLPLFDGGTLAHITACRISGAVTTLDVDTRARDAWNTAQRIEGNREARRDPERKFFRDLASSTIQKDAIAPFSHQGGRINDVTLKAGKWTLVEFFAGDEGILQRLEFETNPNAEVYGIVCAKNIWPRVMERAIGDPSTVEGGERWSDESVFDMLRRDHGMLFAFGTPAEPGGYSPGYKSKGHPLTGRVIDAAGVNYFTYDAPVLRMLAFADRDTKIPGGRIAEPLIGPS